MAEYQRINVKQTWYDKISDFLRENPEEGFEPDDVKQFIKFCTNRYMKKDDGLDRQSEELSEEEIQAVKDLISSKD